MQSRGLFAVEDGVAASVVRGDVGRRLVPVVSGSRLSPSNSTPPRVLKSALEVSPYFVDR